MSLDWSDEAPSRDFPAPATRTGPAATGAPSSGLASGQQSAWRNPPGLVWLVSAGLLATIGIGLYILRYQRRLFAGFLETETLAEQRADELRDTHAALAHSEKMKALGTMAAGVAHDCNNLLSVIRFPANSSRNRRSRTA